MYTLEEKGKREKKQTNVPFATNTRLERLDFYKEQKEFGTRAQMILYLLQIALEQSDNRDGI
ncbi:hypothetical protein [Ectobacillus panaciterrae]|uniref:hypothetical protein n=1 Tax=Ectobacillus panaciterrae TaxID=363872 RepID=UPI0004266D7E|nr:hypothetical protein [Ectobacillus panaciterrae]